MSIYVGDRKAKLYRGDYCPAQLYKGDVKIAGYTDIEKVGTGISGVGTYNDALLPTIDGKSEQTVTVQGKNLLDNRHVSWYSQDAIIQDGWYVAKDGYYSGVRLGFAQIKTGKRYTVTFTYKSDNVGWFTVSPKESTEDIGSTNVSLQLIADNMIHRGKISFIASKDAVARVWLLKYGGASVKGTSMYRDVNVIEEPIESPDVPPYEPFIPNSPSPDYPSPIRSSENFDMVSCGRNLFDEERILPTQGWVKQSDGSFFVKNNSVPYGKAMWENTDGYTGQISIAIQHRRIEAGSKYTGAFPSIEYTDGSRSVPSDFREVKWVSSAFISDRAKVVKQVTWTYGTGSIGTYIKDLLIAKSNTLTPYQPYHITIAHITDPLLNVGDIADSIEVSEGKVEVVRRCTQYTVDGVKNPVFLQVYTSPECAGFVLSAVSAKDIRGLCTHANFSSTILASQTTAEEAFVFGGMPPEYINVYFKLKKLRFQGWQDSWTNVQKAEAFKQWLIAQKTAGTPVITQYILYAPTRTDITATSLGQDLLAMRTYSDYTQVYTNATLPPTLRARIKEISQ